MTGQLQHTGDGPPTAKCVTCSAEAVGPCARCQAPVCGDCCVLTTGAKVWAICLRCDDKAGSTWLSGWWSVALWLGAPILALAAAVLLMELLWR